MCFTCLFNFVIDTTPEQKILYQQFIQKFSNNLENKLREDYLSLGILNNDSIQAEVHKAVSAIS